MRFVETKQRQGASQQQRRHDAGVVVVGCVLRPLYVARRHGVLIDQANGLLDALANRLKQHVELEAGEVGQRVVAVTNGKVA